MSKMNGFMIKNNDTGEETWIELNDETKNKDIDEEQY